MAHRSDADYIQNEHNTARFFVENRQISWILLIATFALGIYGYTKMPKRKDPDIPVRVAQAQCPWPGATAEQVEQLVTRPLEQAAANNTTIRPPSPSITSTTKRARCRCGSHSSTDGGSKNPVSRLIGRKLLIDSPS